MRMKAKPTITFSISDEAIREIATEMRKLRESGSIGIVVALDGFGGLEVVDSSKQYTKGVLPLVLVAHMNIDFPARYITGHDFCTKLVAALKDFPQVRQSA